MLLMFHILTVLLVAVGMGLSLAHALEFPGKKRLGEGTYRQVQQIYYPGFTIGAGVGEFGAMVALAILLLALPYGSASFWWATGALALLLAAHAIYWIVTHPVNGAWTKDLEMGGAGRTFFGVGKASEASWTRLRDTWEWSHVARAVLFFLALAAMAASLTAAN